MIFVDILGMEMHTNTCVCAFAGRGRGGRWHGEHRTKAVLLSGSFMFFSVLCLLCLYGRLYICALWSPLLLALVRGVLL